MIRAARDEDVEALRAIEVAAGRVFADVGMAFVAEDEPLPAEALREYVRDGRAWVVERGGARARSMAATRDAPRTVAPSRRPNV